MNEFSCVFPLCFLEYVRSFSRRVANLATTKFLGKIVNFPYLLGHLLTYWQMGQSSEIFMMKKSEIRHEISSFTPAHGKCHQPLYTNVPNKRVKKRNWCPKYISSQISLYVVGNAWHFFKNESRNWYTFIRNLRMALAAGKTDILDQDQDGSICRWVKAHTRGRTPFTYFMRLKFLRTFLSVHLSGNMIWHVSMMHSRTLENNSRWRHHQIFSHFAIF